MCCLSTGKIMLFIDDDPDLRRVAGPGASRFDAVGRTRAAAAPATANSRPGDESKRTWKTVCVALQGRKMSRMLNRRAGNQRTAVPYTPRP